MWFLSSGVSTRPRAFGKLCRRPEPCFSRNDEAPLRDPSAIFKTACIYSVRSPRCRYLFARPALLTTSVLFDHLLVLHLAGGEDETTIFGELYAFDFTTHTFVQQIFATNMSRPLGRKEHIAFSRTVTSGVGVGSTAMYVFGGQSQADYKNGTRRAELLAFAV